MDLKQLIREILENKDCCKATKSTKAPILNESLAPREILSEGLKYHIDNRKPLTEHVYRAGSLNYFNLWAEARALYTRGILDFSGDDLAILTETQLGEFGIFEGQKVPLDFIMEEIEEELNENNTAELDKIKKEIESLMPSLSWIDDVTVSSYSGDLYIDLDYKLDPQEIKQLSQLASKYNMDLMRKSSGKNASLVKRRVPPKNEDEELNEAEYQGRKVQLGKPMQGDIKKFKVYVKNDKGKVVKVNFGFGGTSAKGKRMSIKVKNPKRRAAFRARHNCENPGPRWKARYWSCKAW